MRKLFPRVYLLEAAAAGLMVAGAVALMLTFFPIINPRQWRAMTKHADPSLALRYSIGSGVTATILGGAFYFNRRAKKAKRDFEHVPDSSQEQ